MIIQSSSTQLASNRSYSSKQSTATATQNLQTGETFVSIGLGTVSLFSDEIQNLLNQGKQKLEDVEQTDTQENQGEEESLTDMLKRYQNTQSVKATSISEKLQQINEVRNKALRYLLEILFGKKSSDYQNLATEGLEEAYSEASSSGTQVVDYQHYRQTTYFHYEEHESVSFSAQGKVVTSDGREMDIHMEVNLSRSFVVETEDYINYSVPVCRDPLVIQLDGSLPAVSDMKFFFDLNSDGEKEEISLLGEGNGFLALDKNEDGIINDGSELFGTRSGNGFWDLAEYDTDKNRWIDEADEVFDKLRIWMKNEDGTDKLISLKDAGIGAISLDSAMTRFAYNNDANVTNAVARRTGFFIYENGGSGSLQQLDMATEEAFA